MKILYVFPHPDDESFGPAPAMIRQRMAGHDVHLLTLTRGEATSQRHRFGYTREQMGEVRCRELQCAGEVIGLEELTILDFPDSGLKDLDPLELEEAVTRRILAVEPEVLVTYPVHGISGFHDHLVTHAVVKRTFCKLRAERPAAVRRLAFFAVFDPVQPSGAFQLESSEENEIDCIVEVDEKAADLGRKALSCYETYQQVIEDSGILEHVRTRDVYFEIFQEDHTPPLDDITKNL